MTVSQWATPLLAFTICTLPPAGPVVVADSFSQKAPYQASFHSTILDDGSDLIFPSIIEATKHFKSALAKYYLYTSPHAGADVRLYLANDVTGPWRLHGTIVDANISRAPHVSSPHAVWNAEAQSLFLYVHAPNAQTIYCHSKDGVHFEYGDICVTREMISEVIPFRSRSASYARVHRHRIPRFGNTWTMTLTASGGINDQGLKNNAIVLCTSDDGIRWTARHPILDDGNEGQDYKSLDACWLPIDGRHFMVYALRTRAESKGNRTEPIRLHLAESDASWKDWQYRGVFYEPSRKYPDDAAARGVSFIEGLTEPLILYEGGQHGAARIGLLKLTRGAIREPFEQ